MALISFKISLNIGLRFRIINIKYLFESFFYLHFKLLNFEHKLSRVSKSIEVYYFYMEFIT